MGTNSKFCEEIRKNIYFLADKKHLIWSCDTFANSVVSNEMAHSKPNHQDLLC